jgi:hypothetical protein
MLSSLGSNALPGAQYFSSRRSVKVSRRSSTEAISSFLISFVFFEQSDSSNIYRGLPVRVLKGPTSSSDPYTATAKVNAGYEPSQTLSSRQPQSADYSSEPDGSNKVAASRDASCILPSMSTVDPRTYERHPASSSYGIHPSTSQDTWVYERSLSSKSDIDAGSDSSSADSDSIHGSPTSGATHLYAAPSANHHVPAHLQKTDTTTSNNTVPAVTRHCSPHPTSISSNKTTSRRVSTPPVSESSGTDTLVSDDASAVQGKSDRERVISLGTRNRDSRVLYPPTTTYLYGGGRNSDSTSVAMSIGPGLDVPYSPNTIGGQLAFSPGDAGRDIHDRFESDDVHLHLPYPPGLEPYTQNVPTGSVHAVSRRRRSDDGQVSTGLARPAVGEHAYPSAGTPTRCVRWDENLICPSPILSSQRRKGWFNRRG